MTDIYWVCDVKKIPEQGCDTELLYIKRIPISEVPEKIKLHKRMLDLIAEHRSKNIDFWTEHGQQDLTSELKPILEEYEEGEYIGVYAPMDGRTIPRGTVFNELPPFLVKPSKETLEDCVKSFWWNIPVQ